jgi:peptidoglycan/LPS O-acetylase OafA/YrhL
LRADNFFEKIKKSQVTKYAFAGLLAIILADAYLERIQYKPPQISILMAGLIVFLIYSNDKMISFFSNGLSRFLGKISFPLYICHFFVLVSYTSWLIIYFQERGVLDFWHSLLIILSSIFLAFLVAGIFARIENVYLARLDSVAKNLLRDTNGKVGFD